MIGPRHLKAARMALGMFARRQMDAFHFLWLSLTYALGFDLGTTKHSHKLLDEAQAQLNRLTDKETTK